MFLGARHWLCSKLYLDGMGDNADDGAWMSCFDIPNDGVTGLALGVGRHLPQPLLKVDLICYEASGWMNIQGLIFYMHFCISHCTPRRTDIRGFG